MIAPDFPEEPAPRNDFSSSMTLPARRLASCQAMLLPMTPPPITRMSQWTAMKLLWKQRRTQVALAQVRQHNHDELPGVFRPLGDLHCGVGGGAAADAAEHALLAGQAPSHRESVVV